MTEVEELRKKLDELEKKELEQKIKGKTEDQGISIEELEKNAGKLTREEKIRRVELVLILLVGYLLVRYFQGGM